MKFLIKYFIYDVLLCILLYNSMYSADTQNIYIRLNQVGYLSQDIKTAVLMSISPINVTSYDIKVRVVTKFCILEL